MHSLQLCAALALIAAVCGSSLTLTHTTPITPFDAFPSAPIRAVPLTVCATIDLSVEAFGDKLTARDSMYTNSGIEWGMYSMLTIEPEEEHDLVVNRPRITLRNVAEGALTVHMPTRGLTTVESARLQQLPDTYMGVIATFPTETSTRLCREFVAEVQLERIHTGAFEFSVCAEWQQPLWTTACLSIPALQLPPAAGHAYVTFPWSVPGRSFPLPAASVPIYVDRRGPISGLSAAALAPGATRVRVRAQVDTVIEASGVYIATPGVAYRMPVSTRKEATRIIDDILPLACVHAGSMDTTELFGVASAVFRQQCNLAFDLSQYLLPPANTTAFAKTLFPAAPVLVEAKLTHTSQRLDVSKVTLQLCATSHEGISVCDAHMGATFHNTSHPGNVAPADEPEFITRVMNSTATAKVRTACEDPPFALRSRRHPVTGESYADPIRGHDDAHAEIELITGAGQLLASCGGPVDNDVMGSRESGVPTYLIGLGYQTRTNISCRNPRSHVSRLCAELSLVQTWHEEFVLREERVVATRVGPWLQNPAHTTNGFLSIDPTTSTVFQSITLCEPRFVHVREPIAVVCVAALPPRKWTVNGVVQTAPAALEATLVGARSNTPMANLEILDVQTRDVGDGYGLVFFTLVIPELPHHGSVDNVCVVPTNFNATPGYTRSSSARATDSDEQCSDSHVRFMHTPGVLEADRDALRVRAAEIPEHETVAGHGVFVDVALDVEAGGSATAQSRRLLQTQAPVVFSTRYITLHHEKSLWVELNRDTAIDMQCPTGLVACTVTHLLFGNGTNDVEVTVPRANLPMNGTFVCLLSVPRVGITTLGTIVNTEQLLLHHYVQSSDGHPFVQTDAAIAVVLEVTFHANAVVPVVTLEVLTETDRVAALESVTQRVALATRIVAAIMLFVLMIAAMVAVAT